jgi:hypothetical protein
MPGYDSGLVYSLISWSPFNNVIQNIVLLTRLGRVPKDPCACPLKSIVLLPVEGIVILLTNTPAFILELESSSSNPAVSNNCRPYVVAIIIILF